MNIVMKRVWSKACAQEGTELTQQKLVVKVSEIIYELSSERQIGDYQVGKGKTVFANTVSSTEAGIIPSRIVVWIESSMCHNGSVMPSPKSPAGLWLCFRCSDNGCSFLPPHRNVSGQRPKFSLAERINE